MAVVPGTVHYHWNRHGTLHHHTLPGGRIGMAPNPVSGSKDEMHDGRGTML